MARRFSPQKQRRPRPFWLPASTYYFLVSGVVVGIFFLTWGVLSDGREEPWIAAGILASGTMIAAVAVREVIFRIRQKNIYLAQKRLDTSFTIPGSHRGSGHNEKLTVQQNDALIREIRKRSEAAEIFGNQAENHRQVFLLCEEYLSIAQKQLSSVSVSSPRLAALTKGRRRVERLHRHHTLRWAEIEVTRSTSMARERVSPVHKLDDARKALEVVATASAKYPHENVLNESKDVLISLVRSLQFGQMISEAEEFEAKAETGNAERIYQTILRTIDESDHNFRDEDATLRAIIAERLESLSNLTDPQDESDNFDLIV